MKIRYQNISCPNVYKHTLDNIINTGLFGAPQSFGRGCWLLLKGTDYAFRLMYHCPKSGSYIMSKVWKNIVMDREVELYDLEDVLDYLPTEVQEKIVFHLDLFR